MTNNPSRSSLQQLPHLKTVETATSSKTPSLSVPLHKTHKSLPASRSLSHTGQTTKVSSNTGQLDATSDKATASLIRRILCPQAASLGSDQRERCSPQPLDEILPPLTSSNEVDLQLYALIAIIIKEFVYSWYSKITPDHVFVEEVIQVIAHCTRALEQRLRRVDIHALVLDEIPALIEAHIVCEG